MFACFRFRQARTGSHFPALFEKKSERNFLERFLINRPSHKNSVADFRAKNSSIRVEHANRIISHYSPENFRLQSGSKTPPTSRLMRSYAILDGIGQPIRLPISKSSRSDRQPRNHPRFSPSDRPQNRSESRPRHPPPWKTFRSIPFSFSGDFSKNGTQRNGTKNVFGSGPRTAGRALPAGGFSRLGSPTGPLSPPASGAHRWANSTGRRRVPVGGGYR